MSNHCFTNFTEEKELLLSDGCPVFIIGFEEIECEFKDGPDKKMRRKVTVINLFHPM